MDRANEGARIHRRLQKAAGGNYRAEVPLSHTEEYGGFTYVVEGRADGIIDSPELTVIDEIKTTAVPMEWITENWNPVHWAQALSLIHI